MATSHQRQRRGRCLGRCSARLMVAVLLQEPAGEEARRQPQSRLALRMGFAWPLGVHNVRLVLEAPLACCGRREHGWLGMQADCS